MGILRVLIVKPNATIPYLRSMTAATLDGHIIEASIVDEYVQSDLGGLKQLDRGDAPTLLAARVS
jgi:hypothetical protein